MSTISHFSIELPPWQQAIRHKCYHPSGTYVAFRPEAVNGSIPDRFEEMVQTFPDRLAVESKGHHVTYRELQEAANRLAHVILDHCDIGQEPIVLLLREGISQVGAIFGVLKAGKFYVTLAPSLPKERLVRILHDSEARVIVTDSDGLPLAKQLGDSSLKVINISELPVVGGTENPKVPIAPDDYAFVLYTSGSTGAPKGAIQSHRNVLHSIMVQTEQYHTCAEDRFIFIASSGRVIYRALLNGASVFPASLRAYGPRGIVDLLMREKITIYSSVATAFRQITSTMAGEEEFPHLRIVGVTGETVEKRDLEIYKRYFSSDCIFVNGFGSSEWFSATYFFADKDTQIDHATVPVGYPSKDQEILLLDEAGKAVGCNEPGEIVVKSKYLSPGYWRRPDLTEARYSFDTSDLDGPSTYRTGDLAIRLPDGCLVHMGRIDFQVKIRGNRVEFAEVESALSEIEGVDAAVVAMRKDGHGNQRMIAYIVSKQDLAPTAVAMRRTLAKRLPDFMVPSAFVQLDALPLIGIGKVDRQSLPEPSPARPELDTAYVGPRTLIEEQLVQIWEEVLGVDRVGIHDNFLDLGGHSLLATRIISRVVQEFHVELPLYLLFEAPTVAAMAVVIAQNLSKAAAPEDVASILAELETLSDAETRNNLG